MSCSHDKDFEVYLEGIVNLMSLPMGRFSDQFPSSRLSTFLGHSAFAKCIFMNLGTEVHAMSFDSFDWILLLEDTVPSQVLIVLKLYPFELTC